MRKIISSVLCAALICFMFSACGNAEAKSAFQEAEQDPHTVSYTNSESTTSGNITLSDSGISADCGGVAIDGSTVTISAEGSYVLSGKLSNGQIIIAAPKEAKVELTLKGADIACAGSAPIYAKTADKLIIATAGASENNLSSTGDFVQTDDNTVDAAIFSKCDLTLKGEGLLNVSCQSGHGIVTKDDLKISGGRYNIEAALKGICGKDSVTVNGGSFNIVSGGDGISANNDEDAEKGNVTINDGGITIASGDDGIHAEKALNVCGGVINITKCYEGLEGLTVDISGGDISIKAADDGVNAAGVADSGSDGSPFGQDPFAVTEGAYVSISGGTLNICADGDGIDSNGALYVSGGSTYVSGPSNSGNGALDYAGEGSISEGVFIAAGATGMAMSFGEKSTQGVIFYCFDTVQPSGSFTLTDESGAIIAQCALKNEYQCIVISAPELISGGSYTLSTDSGEQTVTMTSLNYSNGMTGGGVKSGAMGRPDMPQGGMPQSGSMTPPEGLPQDGSMTPPEGFGGRFHGKG